MEATEKKKKLVESPLSDLAEKKSERTTFKLTREATDDLVWLQDQYYINAKEVFDHLCIRILMESKDTILNSLKQTSKDTLDKLKESSIRKTYVLSRGSIKILTDIASENNLSRDLLASILITTFKGMVRTQLEEEHEKQTQIFDLLNKFYSDAITTEKMIASTIPDTSVLDQFRKILELTEKLVKKINSHRTF